MRVGHLGAARAAGRGRPAGAGEDLLHESVVGTVFTGRVACGSAAAGLVTEVTGAAYRTGEHAFRADPHDALATGFLL